MRRSWLVWTVSIFAFFLTAVLVVTSGPAQEHAGSTVGSTQGAIRGASRLPNLNSNARNSLTPSSANGATDFTTQSPSATYNSALDSTVDVGDSDVPGTTFASSGIGYQPSEIVRLADPSNYGERVTRDANGNPLDNDYIVVLHETVGSAMSALNLFEVNHPRDEDQVSYHTLIALDGTVIYVVPPESRAFGAGNSAFKSFSGEEAVFTNPDFPSSVNNFAYHISLETPPDGLNNNSPVHSGYTEAQYQSLAWLLARTNIPDDRITTHEAVDRSGSRMDPRSFEADRMFQILRQYPSRQARG